MRAATYALIRHGNTTGTGRCTMGTEWELVCNIGTQREQLGDDLMYHGNTTKTGKLLTTLLYNGNRKGTSIIVSWEQKGN